MSRNKEPYIKSALAISVFLIGFMAVYVIMPKNHFKYNMDVFLSPVGMAMSKTFLSNPASAPENFQGYIDNGEFASYKNWPPLSFRVLAGWYRLIGESDIYTSRVFSALVYAINAMLFYLLMIKCGVSKLTSFFSTLIFIFLPSHLDFSYLIYADIWCITFWLISLLVLKSEIRYKHWVFISVALLGTLFYWFVIFIIPAYVFCEYYKNDRKRGVRLFILSGVFILIFEAFLFGISKRAPEVQLIRQLYKYSVLGFFMEPEYYGILLVKRIVSLGYELFCLIPLLFFWKRFYSVVIKASDSPTKELKEVLELCLVAFYLFLIVFTNWFNIHRQGLFLVSIPIAAFSAMIFSYCERKSRNLLYRGVATSLCICWSLFLCFPLLANTKSKIAHQDSEIAKFINERKGALKPCLFFDMEEEKEHEQSMLKSAIREYTRAYIFNLEADDDLIEEVYMEGSMLKLEDIQVSDYDHHFVFVISDRDSDVSNLMVQDSTTINGVKVFQIKI